MENQSTAGDDNPHASLINTFCEITACPSKSDALFFLESHNFDLDAAVSTFIDNANPSHQSPSPSNLPSQSASPSPSPRSRSPSPTSRSYNLRSLADPKPKTGRRTALTTLSDLRTNPKDEDSDSDPDFDPQEYYTGGQNSGMLVQDPSKANDVDTIFDQARRAGGVEPSAQHHLPSSSSRNFTGTGRLLSGEVLSTPTPQPPEAVTHNITFWRNGFTVDDGPLRRLDDPQNASFLESIKKSECPGELAPADKRSAVHVHLMRKEEDYKEPKKVQRPFQGMGRTLGSSETGSEESSSRVTTTLTTAEAPSEGVIVDPNQPSTSIQVRLADGSRMVSRFNNQHRIRDIHRFIDASRGGGTGGAYELQSMGFPPKKLRDVDQTIEEAGIGNSVVIQKLLR